LAPKKGRGARAPALPRVLEVRGRSSVVDDERRELEAAGWEPEERDSGVVWRNPESGFWYPQGVAVAILREGLDPGDLPKEPEGGTA
jgi:hypothetical protein